MKFYCDLKNKYLTESELEQRDCLGLRRNAQCPRLKEVNE